MYSLALDILLAILLVATIGYAMVLNKKLSSLRRHKEDLEQLAATFNSSTMRAKDSIAGLKNSSAKLQAEIVKAAGLKDDLKFLIDRGTSAADRLETAVRESRGDKSAAVNTGPPKPCQPVETIAEAVARANALSQKEPMPDGNGGTNGVAPSLVEDDENVSRSQAERELIAALRSAR